MFDPMTEPVKKRKAEEQVSPYSQDPDENSHIPDTQELEQTRPLRKARSKKTQTTEKSSLKGIFGGNVTLTSESKETQQPPSEKDQMIAGLNSSFIKTIKIVLEKQANKDLRYLFEQYKKFFDDIIQNNK